MNYRLTLSIFSFLFLFGFNMLHSQAITIVNEKEPTELYSLIPDHVQLTSNFRIFNNTGEALYIDFITEEINLPPNWQTDPNEISLNGEFYIIPTVGKFCAPTHLNLTEAGFDDVGLGYQILRIKVYDKNDNVLYEGTERIEYELAAPQVPSSPTFMITTYQVDTLTILPADTIYLNVNIIDDNNLFFNSYAEFQFIDNWGIDRPIVFDPIELISENVNATECIVDDPFFMDHDKYWCQGDMITVTSSYFEWLNMNGYLDSKDDFDYEVLFNVYDPADSLNSNQQIRFIARSYECLDPTWTQIIDAQDSINVEICLGGDVTLTALPEFTNVEWYINGVPNFGNTLELTGVMENIYIQIFAQDSAGCNFIDDYFISIEQNYEEIVENETELGELFTCPGADVTLVAKDEYSDVEWYNTNTGVTSYGQELTILDIQDFYHFTIIGKKTDGCYAMAYFNIILDNQPGAIIENSEDADYEVQLCPGSEFELTAKSEYTEVRWYNQETGDSIFSNSILVTDVQANQHYFVEARAADGCLHFQFVYIYVINEYFWDENILDMTNLNPPFCKIVELNAQAGYQDLEWYYQDPISFDSVRFGTGPSVTLDLSMYLEVEYNELYIRGTNEDNCLVEFYYPIEFKQPENRALIKVLTTDTYCEGDIIELTAEDGYTSYRWEYQNQTYSDQNINVAAFNEPVTLICSDADGCSYIDTYYFNLDNLPSPQICVVTNDPSTGHNVVLWESPQDSSNIVRYSVYREGSSTNDFELLGEVDFNGSNIFIDDTADSNQQAYKYVVTASNDCEDESDLSDFHKTIHLTINLGSNDNINLIWDSYVGINYDQVKIYRGSSLSTLDEYVSLPSTVLSFTDQNPPAGDVFYQIEIPSEIDCQTGKRLVNVRSNVASLGLDAVEDLSLAGSIYPNPFKDELTLELEVSGRLTIYNIMGQEVINTVVTKGTNTLDTALLQAGNYILKISDSENNYTANFIKQ